MTLPNNLKECIYDYSIGDKRFWKSKFNEVLNDIEIHNPEMLVCVCFCDDKNEFNSYRRMKDLQIDIYNLMEYIEGLKFKDKIKHGVLNILSNMSHPNYKLIEHELS